VEPEAVQRAAVWRAALYTADFGAVLHASEPGAVQQAAVQVTELRTADFEAVLRTEASGAAAKRTVLQSARGGKLGVEQARQFGIIDAFSSFFKKIFHFSKNFCSKNFTGQKNFVDQAMEFFPLKKIYPSHCQGPHPSQRPKKAQHVQDLKAP
jgi:hypothetical protein